MVVVGARVRSMLVNGSLALCVKARKLLKRIPEV
jgi:hypothetical protein